MRGSGLIDLRVLRGQVELATAKGLAMVEKNA